MLLCDVTVLTDCLIWIFLSFQLNSSGTDTHADIASMWCFTWQWQHCNRFINIHFVIFIETSRLLNCYACKFNVREQSYFDETYRNVSIKQLVYTGSCTLNCVIKQYYVFHVSLYTIFFIQNINDFWTKLWKWATLNVNSL